jgi:hypothetical protein
MKKKLLSVIISLGLALCFPLSSFADTISGGSGWKVTFTADEKMESNFTTGKMSDTISGMQPGDTAVFTVALGNENETTVDYYMANKILKSLEESKNTGTKGGAYTYILTYTGPDGSTKTIFDSDRVGGAIVNEKEGLYQATQGLENFFFLDSYKKGQTGNITLTISLDGETQGNDYQDTLADLQMNFAVMLRTAGEYGNEGDDETGRERNPRVVQTGDNTNLKPFFIIAICASVVLVGLGILGTVERRKMKKGGEA